MNRIQIGISAIISWILIVIGIVYAKISGYPPGLIPHDELTVWIFYCVLIIMMITVAAFMIFILAIGSSSTEVETDPELGRNEKVARELEAEKNVKKEKPLQPRQKKKKGTGKQKPKGKSETEQQEEAQSPISPPGSTKPENEVPPEWRDEEKEWD